MFTHTIADVTGTFFTKDARSVVKAQLSPTFTLHAALNSMSDVEVAKLITRFKSTTITDSVFMFFQQSLLLETPINYALYKEWEQSQK